jgi:hypothetical protein
MALRRIMARNELACLGSPHGFIHFSELVHQNTIKAMSDLTKNTHLKCA